MIWSGPASALGLAFSSVKQESKFLLVLSFVPAECKVYNISGVYSTVVLNSCHYTHGILIILHEYAKYPRINLGQYHKNETE
jgi:hypothetical protein